MFSVNVSSRFRGIKPSLIIHFYGAQFLFILEDLSALAQATCNIRKRNWMLTDLVPSHASSLKRVPVTSTFIYSLKSIIVEECALAGVIERRGGHFTV